MRITILTCDKNSWVLPLTFHFLSKFWPDCPFGVDIVTGMKPVKPWNLWLEKPRPPLPIFTEFESKATVYHSDDAIWSDLLLEYLTSLADDELRLLLLEDYLLADKINTAAIQACKTILEEEGAAFFRLNACPGPKLSFERRKGFRPAFKIGRFDVHASYLTSTQPTIWRVNYLRRIIARNESGWDFEIKGTNRARIIPALRLGVWEGALMPIMNYLRRGKVEPNAHTEMEAKW